MIDACILEGEAYGLIRLRGIQAGPYLRADPGAVGIAPQLVVVFAGHGRQYAFPHVGFAYAVFVPVGRDKTDPVFAQGLAVDGIRPQVVHGPQPYQLQVQVVVGQGLAFPGGKPMDIEEIPRAFIGRTQGAAYVFADPAGINAVAELFFRKPEHIVTLLFKSLWKVYLF